MNIAYWIECKQNVIKKLESMQGNPQFDQEEVARLLQNARTDLSEFPAEYARVKGTEAQRCFDQFLSVA